MQPLQLGDGLGIDPGQGVALFQDQHVAAARPLLRAQRAEQIGPRRLGPVGTRLDHPAGGDRSDTDVGSHHQQFILARRRGELDVGILLGLDAGGERQCRRPDRQMFGTHTRIPCLLRLRIMLES